MKQLCNISLPVFIAIALSLIAFPVFSFEENPEGQFDSALFSLPLEDLLKVKVSVASRFEQSVIDAPSNVTVISKAQLNNWNVSSLWDLMARIPSMVATLDRDQKVISARGLVDGNTRGVLILVNGVPFYDTNTLASRGIESQSLDLRLLEQVEILRGPGGISWTGNPLLAVINLKMKKATEQDSEIHAFVGTESTFGGSFVAGLDKEEWQLNVNGSYYQSQGTEIDSLTSINPAGDRIRLNEVFSNQNPPFGSTSFQLDEHKESYSLFGELTYGQFKLQSFYMDFLGNNRQQEIGMGRELLESLNRGFINLSYDWIISENTILNANYTGAKHDMHWYGSKTSEPTIGLIREAINHTYSLAFKQDYQDSALNLSLDYLTRGKTVSKNSNDMVEPPSVKYNTSIPLKQFNLVVQYDKSLNDNLALKLGGKWVDSEQGDVHINNFSPQFVAIWKSSQQQVFKLAYNSGTLRPDADQIQQGLDENTEQQTIKSYDLIWYQQLFEEWTSTVTLYHQELEDRIIQRVVDGQKSYGSIGDTISKGLTFEVNGVIAEQLFWANVSYTNAQYSGNAPAGLTPDSLRFDETGQALAFPEWTANMGLTYEGERLSISPAIRYRSATTNRVLSAVDTGTGVADYQDMPTSIQLDVNIQYAISANTSIALFVSNFFDETDSISTSIFNGYTQQYGRFARLELSHHF